MERYINTERIGVNRVEAMFLGFNWIFRGQPLVDVGIDAIVEIVNQGNPTGKLIAIQIKSGESHFTKTSNENWTHYISNVHKHYWLNYDIPVILCGYFPQKDEVLWENITEKNLFTTPTKWKIEIPKEKKLESHSIRELLEISNSFIPKKNQIDIIKLLNKDYSEYDTQYSRFHFLDMEESLESLNHALLKLNKRFKEFQQIFPRGNSLHNPSTKAYIYILSNSINIFSIRLKNEINVIVPSFSNGYFLLEKLLGSNKLDSNAYSKIRDYLSTLLTSMKITIFSYENLAKSLDTLPVHDENFSGCNKAHQEISSQFITELRTIKAMSETMLEIISKEKK